MKPCLLLIAMSTACFVEHEDAELEDGVVPLGSANLHVAATRVHDGPPDGFGTFTYVVDVTPIVDCLEIEGTVEGIWNGMPMRLVEPIDPCRRIRFEIEASRVAGAAVAMIRVQDDRSGVAGQYPAETIALPTLAKEDGTPWQLAAGTTLTLRPSAVMTVLPALYFVRDGTPTKGWPEPIYGTVTDGVVAFELPASLPVTGDGEAMVALGWSSGFVLQCSSGRRCGYDVEQLLILRAVAQ